MISFTSQYFCIMEDELLVRENDIGMNSTATATTLASHGLPHENEPLSKNKLRKIKRHSKLLENRKSKRVLEKAKRKEHNHSKEIVVHRKFRGNDEKLEAIERLKDGLINGPKVVIDCQYEHVMSEKEKKRFAQQIRRCYSANRAFDKPLHLYLTSLRENSDFFRICEKQNTGFRQYIVDVTDKHVVELFSESVSDVVYLTPDAKVDLEEFNCSKIYVIGGIVDETTSNNISFKFAQGKGFATAKIPIDKYFSRKENGTYKKVLTVNQVVDIIIEWHRTHDWVKSIQAGLPERSGFVPTDL